MRILKINNQNQKLFLFKLLVLFVAISGLVVFVKNNAIVISQMKNVPIWASLSIGGVFVLTQFVASVQFKIYLSLSKIRLSLFDSFCFIWQQSFGNYFLFSLGFVANMMSLKKLENLSKVDFASYMLGDQIIKLFSFSLILICLVSYNFIFSDIAKNDLFHFGIAGALCLPIIFLFALSFFKKAPFNNTLIERTVVGLKRMIQNPSLLIYSLFLHVLIMILMSAKFYIISLNFKMHIQFIDLMSFSILVNVLKIASLVPGNIGIRETVAGASLKTFGYTFEGGVSLALFDRILCTSIIFIFGIASMLLINRKFGKRDHVGVKYSCQKY